MRFVNIFGRWYVKPKYRLGKEADEKGRIRLRFAGLDDQARVRVKGRLCNVVDGCAYIRGEEGDERISVLLPDGTEQEVEPLVYNDGRLEPQREWNERLLFEVALRLQRLEMYEEEDRKKIEKINDRKKGKMFLGGSRK